MKLVPRCALWLVLLLSIALLPGLPPAAAVQDPNPEPHELGNADSAVFMPLVLNNSCDAPTAVEVSPEAGGGGSTADGTLTVTVPPGAVGENVTLTLEPTDEQPPDHVSDFGRMYAITARNSADQLVTTLAAPITLALSYADLDLRYIDPATLAIYHHEADGSWMALPTTLDLGARVARATTTRLSDFGLFTAPSQTYWLPYSLVRDDDGTLYAIEDFELTRIPSGSSEPTLYYDWGWGSEHPGGALTLDGVDLAIDQDTNTLYFTDVGNRVYAVSSALQERVFYDGFAYALDFDQANDELYVADDSRVWALNATTGEAVASYLLPTFGEHVEDIALDSAGGLYVITTRTAREGLPHWQFWGTLYYHDPTYDTWWTIASGFAYPYRLDVDDQDNVYITNRVGDAISVISGGQRTVAGFIATSMGNSALLVDGNRLILGGEGGLRTLPRTRRDTLLGDLTTSLSPGDTLSGRDNVITLETSLQSDIAAHNFLRINGRTALTPMAVTEGTLTYRLPAPVWYGDPYWDGGNTYRFCVGDRCDAGTLAPLPELGNWEYVPNLMVDQTLTVAQNEWLVWRGGFEIDRVASRDGLFADWQAPGDAATGWLAYRFTELGTTTFTVTDRDGTPHTQTIHVTRMGRPTGRTQAFTVDPRRGATIYNQGAILDIPPGALPGTAAYDVTFGNDGVDDEPPFQGTYGARSRGYDVIYDPEPTHLNLAITLRVPYDPDAVPSPPQAGLYAPTVDDLLNLRSSTDGESVLLTFPAGDYLADDAPDPLNPSAAQLALTAEGGIGYRLKGALNTLGKGIYWASGLPNAMLGDEHFAIVYHTGDAISDTYVETLLSALQKARADYLSLGYSLPEKEVMVKIAPWANTLLGAEGFAPQRGVFGYYCMFINGDLAPEALRTTGAHEYFHIAQSETQGFWTSMPPKWWREGTAVWAEYLEYPDSLSYKERIEYGGDFVHVPYREWSTALSTDQSYGAMAFVAYLEEQHHNAVLKVYQEWANSIDIYGALAYVIANEETFYEGFAKAYWQEAYATADTWDLNKHTPEHTFTTFKHRVVNNTGGSLSSFLDNWYYTGTGGPISYQDGGGTALRVANSCVGRSLYILDGDKQETGINVIDDQVSPNGGYGLNPLATYDRTNSLYFLVVNGEVQDPTCRLEVYLDTPTITSIEPVGVLAGQTTRVTITGGGFGPVEGSVDNATVVPGGWGEEEITVDVTPGSAGNLELVVRHDVGDVGSNPTTLLVY